ncbi:MAG: SRPBCC domain-containing protein [Methanosarcina sp.]
MWNRKEPEYPFIFNSSIGRGGNKIINKLTKITAEPGKQEIIIEREFDAPRDLVFKAFTDPELYMQWISPRGLTMELEPPERIIGKFEGLPEKGQVILDTARFEVLPGNRTKLISQSVFRSIEDRDWMLQSGMEEGLNGSYSRLDKLLEKMKK